MKIPVHTDPSYDIWIENGVSAQVGACVRTCLPGGSCMLVSDDKVFGLYGAAAEQSLTQAGFRVHTFVFPHGEASKSTGTLLELWDKMADVGLTRGDFCLALGGGVVGDLTGFAAATYLRGIRYVSVPTSLLAMVDSSVGGKTAINLPAGKNLAGAFHQPALVLCDPLLPETLPAHFYSDGMAEVIKYAFLGCPALLALLENDGDLSEIIKLCVEEKRRLVEADERDLGQRQLLNFGHTAGHAIERLSGYTVSHGFAVAAGMAMLTRASVRLGNCEQETYERLQALLQKFGLPTDCPYDPTELAQAALHDKKRDGDTVNLVLPVRGGSCALFPTAVSKLAEVFVNA